MKESNGDCTDIEGAEAEIWREWVTAIEMLRDIRTNQRLFEAKRSSS
jgi:hypothetical protein